MIKLKKLKITKKQQENLPLFYSYVVFNEMMDMKESQMRFKFNEQIDSKIYFVRPEKPISKIIDHLNKTK